MGRVDRAVSVSSYVARGGVAFISSDWAVGFHSVKGASATPTSSRQCPLLYYSWSSVISYDRLSTASGTRLENAGAKSRAIRSAFTAQRWALSGLDGIDVGDMGRKKNVYILIRPVAIIIIKEF